MPVLRSLTSRAFHKLGRVVRGRLMPLRDPVRVAIAGCGVIFDDHRDAYQATGRARIVAVCDPDPVRLESSLVALPHRLPAATSITRRCWTTASPSWSAFAPAPGCTLPW